MRLRETLGGCRNTGYRVGDFERSDLTPGVWWRHVRARTRTHKVVPSSSGALSWHIHESPGHLQDLTGPDYPQVMLASGVFQNDPSPD